MITVRRSELRRHIRSEDQVTWLSFDPADGADPYRGGFRALESLNEEAPAPNMELQPSAETNLEIVTYVREGALIHRSELIPLGRLETGEFQRMTSNSSIRHTFTNASRSSPAHVFQSCIACDDSEVMASEQKRFSAAERKGVLKLVASSDGRDGSIRMHQDVGIYSSILLKGHHIVYALAPGRAAWLHLVKGRISLFEHFLATGDAAALEDERAVSFTALINSEVILFNLA
jgi:redox-sensitive bicupin YhaK (pirin superfamily)